MTDPMNLLPTGDFTTTPPPSGRPGTRESSEWKKIADTLRGNPGLWRKVATNARPQLVQKIKSGKIAAFRDTTGSFEAVSRDADPDTGRADIWARFVR